MDPPENIPLNPIPIATKQDRFIEEKVDSLFALFPQEGDELKCRLRNTVRYIETDRKHLRPGDHYLHPSQTGLPFHILISREKPKEEQIFILPKQLLLGLGSFKTVREGIDYNRCIKVASATIKGDGSDIEKGVKEYQLQRLFKISYAKFIYTGKSRQKLKIIMRIANQGTFENLLNITTRGRYYDLSKKQRTDLLSGLLRLIYKFHKKGYVVADLKPENILWNMNEKNKVDVIITDLGLSYHISDKDCQRVCGTPQTVGPEIIANMQGYSEKIGKPVDIFSLGFVIWSVFLGGTPPWLIDCPRLKANEQTFVDPEAYHDFWEKYRYPKGTLEEWIHRMMDRDPFNRPTIRKIKKALAGKDPKNMIERHCGGVRLLTYIENLITLTAFQNERVRVKREYEDLKQEIRNASHFDEEVMRRYEYICYDYELRYRSITKFYTLSTPPNDHGKVRVISFKNEMGEQKTVNFPNNESLIYDYVLKQKLTMCLNFWQFVK